MTYNVDQVSPLAMEAQWNVMVIVQIPAAAHMVGVILLPCTVTVRVVLIIDQTVCVRSL